MNLVIIFCIIITTLISTVTYAYPSGLYCARDNKKQKIEVHVKSTKFLSLRIGNVKCSDLQYAFCKENLTVSNSECDLNLHNNLRYESSTNRFYFKDIEMRQEICHTTAHAKKLFEPSNDIPIRLPSLNIERHSVATAGCSHAGDFASQFHIAFSNLVSASCGTFSRIEYFSLKQITSNNHSIFGTTISLCCNSILERLPRTSRQ